MFKTIDFSNRANWETASATNVADIGTALETTGWARVETNSGAVYVRKKDDGEEVCLRLPRQNEGSYSPAILNAAMNAAYFYDKPSEEVLERWGTLRYDQARFRIVTEEAKGGALSLENVVELAQGVVSAISSATKDVESPSTAHKRVSSAAINELAKRARFGLTEKGSYVVNVYVPTEEAKDGGAFQETSARLFRLGLEHLAATYELAEKSDKEPLEAFLDANKEERASANLLEAILKTTFDGKADVEFSVKWSPLTAPSRRVPSRVYLKKERAEKLRERANALRPTPKEEKRTFYATVVALEELGRGEVDGRPFGKAVFIVEDDAEDYRAEASLSANDFQKVCEAFYPKENVAFEASIIKNGAKATVNELSNLRSAKNV